MEFFEWVLQFGMHMVDFVLHIDKHLASLSATLGPWLYVVLFAIVFAETGLVVFPVLPGDSLLFAAGAIAALPDAQMDVGLLIFLLIVAAISGDFVNYHIGKYIGPRIFKKEDSWLLNKKHLLYTKSFYERYGGKTIIIARFVPIVRTFAPFVAGIGHMTYKRFVSYNVFGAIVWVMLFTLAGFWMGNIPTIQKNFHIVIFAIIAISIAPAIFEVQKEYRKKRRSTKAHTQH